METRIDVSHNEDGMPDDFTNLEYITFCGHDHEEDNFYYDIENNRFVVDRYGYPSADDGADAVYCGRYVLSFEELERVINLLKEENNVEKLELMQNVCQIDLKKKLAQLRIIGHKEKNG